MTASPWVFQAICSTSMPTGSLRRKTTKKPTCSNTLSHAAPVGQSRHDQFEVFDRKCLGFLLRAAVGARYRPTFGGLLSRRLDRRSPGTQALATAPPVTGQAYARRVPLKNAPNANDGSLVGRQLASLVQIVLDRRSKCLVCVVGHSVTRIALWHAARPMSMCGTTAVRIADVEALLGWASCFGGDRRAAQGGVAHIGRS